jgi:hypothetical protein
MKLNRKKTIVCVVTSTFAMSDTWKDMLRYDRAFVKPEEEGERTDRRIVIFPELKTTRMGAYAAGPTMARWFSYGFKLETIEGGKREEILEDFVCHPTSGSPIGL